MQNKIDDENLRDVNGGAGNTATGKTTNTNICGTRETMCPKCKEIRKFNLYTGGRAICQTCGEEIML